MPQYKAPMRDMRFLMNEVFDYPEHYTQLSNGAEATPDMVEAILADFLARHKASKDPTSGDDHSTG